MTVPTTTAPASPEAFLYGDVPRRFAPIALHDMQPEQRQAAQSLIDSPRGGVRGPFHALLRNPRLAQRVRALGESIRFESQVAVDLREFVILLVARHWSAQYEWHAHSLAAREAGIEAAVVDAIGEGRTPSGMSDDQRLLHAFFTELLSSKDVCDATYDATLLRFGENELLELICTAAYYSFVSMILNTVRHPVPEGGRPLPAVVPERNSSREMEQ
jgi:4-carboxymuconolactone decarboxylase